MREIVNKVLDVAERNLDAGLERTFELLRIPSVSTDPAHAGDCRAAAAWLRDVLDDLGFRAVVAPTDGQPVVLAHGDFQEDGPRALFYGHYDVQPPDPLDEWEADPFEPRLVDGEGGTRIIARGASDDKGQLMTFLEACRAWREVAGGLPLSLTIMLEGEEETGSPNMLTFLDDHLEALRADVVLVCDTNMWNSELPAVITRLRGLVYEEVEITAANRDLHSGMYGGPAVNPLRVLSRILGALHDEDGRVTLPGFYDQVPEAPAEILAQWRDLGFDEAGFLADIGLSVSAAEKGRGVLEALWARPTLEINGLSGGYTGPGAKTVIPTRAMAKLSFRLVGDQDPEGAREALRAFIRERLPADCKVRFTPLAASPGVVMDLDGPFMRAARAALRDEFDREPVLIGEGGSIPAVEALRNRLGMDALLIGFGLDDDRIHSPNEKYDLASFRHGVRSWVRILDRLSRVNPT